MLKELEAVLGNDPITYEKLQKLHYCDAIIKEVFRIMPTVSVVFRVNSKPDEIDGHHFESSTIFMINLPGIHMHNAHWDNPQKFDPQRFMDKNIEGNTLIPFGGGTRICPGKQLSMLQIKALLALLYGKYDVELVDMNAPIKYCSTTLTEYSNASLSQVDLRNMVKIHLIGYELVRGNKISLNFINGLFVAADAEI
ncbi:24421_t:CDS:2 [Gigaspora margarita]|uniref:24421_t:CDS:1 n=1 Tax=Gigaspora margarita TaxID=4874 RepID=A0ABN7V9Z4_GIGMA|nr:24421_t:CDS:2 [Gigaspora margarita]